MYSFVKYINNSSSATLKKHLASLNSSPETYCSTPAKVPRLLYTFPIQVYLVLYLLVTKVHRSVSDNPHLLTSNS